MENNVTVQLLTEDNFTVVYPSWQTYKDLGGYWAYYTFTRGACKPNGHSILASDMIFYMSFVSLLYYIYIMTVIWTRTKLHKTFRICATVLFIGDFVVLTTAWREGVLYACVFQQRGDYNMAWESIAAFSLDLRCSTTCLLAIVRFACLAKVQNTLTLSIVGTAVCFAFASTTFSLSTLGISRIIWFTDDDYHDEDIEPFQSIRQHLLLFFIVTSFVLYIACIVKAFRLKFTVTSTKRKAAQHKQEILVLAQSLLIFLGELLFLYASFFLGIDWGIGSVHFNSNLYYIVRPFSAASTPIFYTIFGSEIRRGTFVSAIVLHFRRAQPLAHTIMVTAATTLSTTPATSRPCRPVFATIR